MKKQSKLNLKLMEVKNLNKGRCYKDRRGGKFCHFFYPYIKDEEKKMLTINDLENIKQDLKNSSNKVNDMKIFEVEKINNDGSLTNIAMIQKSRMGRQVPITVKLDYFAILSTEGEERAKISEYFINKYNKIAEEEKIEYAIKEIDKETILALVTSGILIQEQLLRITQRQLINLIRQNFNDNILRKVIRIKATLEENKGGKVNEFR